MQQMEEYLRSEIQGILDNVTHRHRPPSFFHMLPLLGRLGTFDPEHVMDIFNDAANEKNIYTNSRWVLERKENGYYEYNALYSMPGTDTIYMLRIMYKDNGVLFCIATGKHMGPREEMERMYRFGDYSCQNYPNRRFGGVAVSGK